MKRKSNHGEAEVTAKRIQVDTVSNGNVDVTVCGGYVSNKESAIVIGSDQEALRNVSSYIKWISEKSQMRSSEPLGYQNVQNIKGDC